MSKTESTRVVVDGNAGDELHLKKREELTGEINESVGHISDGWKWFVLKKKSSGEWELLGRRNVFHEADDLFVEKGRGMGFGTSRLVAGIDEKSNSQVGEYNG